MKLLPLIALSYIAAAPAFAVVNYQPKGQEISLADAAKEIVAHDDGQYTFDHGKLFVELKDTYAVAPSVDALEAEVKKIAPVKTVGNQFSTWDLGWNQVGTSGEPGHFDVFKDLRSFQEDSKSMDPAQTPDDLFQSVISIYTDSYQPVTVIGNYATVVHVESGFSGGAHDWVSYGFETYDSISSAPATLLDLVDNADLLAKLKADTYLQKMAKQAKMLSQFKRVVQLTDFAELCSKMSFGADEPVTWSYEPLEQFQHFAIWDYDVKTGEALVRIGLEYNSEVNRGAFKQLGLRVKVKPDAMAALKEAKLKGNGIFMKDVKVPNVNN